VINTHVTKLTSEIPERCSLSQDTFAEVFEPMKLPHLVLVYTTKQPCTANGAPRGWSEFSCRTGISRILEPPQACVRLGGSESGTFPASPYILHGFHSVYGQTIVGFTETLLDQVRPLSNHVPRTAFPAHKHCCSPESPDTLSIRPFRLWGVAGRQDVSR
jgi:hypothetical protein